MSDENTLSPALEAIKKNLASASTDKPAAKSHAGSMTPEPVEFVAPPVGKGRKAKRPPQTLKGFAVIGKLPLRCLGVNLCEMNLEDIRNFTAEIGSTDCSKIEIPSEWVLERIKVANAASRLDAIDELLITLLRNGATNEPGLTRVRARSIIEIDAE